MRTKIVVAEITAAAEARAGERIAAAGRVARELGILVTDLSSLKAGYLSVDTGRGPRAARLLRMIESLREDLGYFSKPFASFVAENAACIDDGVVESIRSFMQWTETYRQDLRARVDAFGEEFVADMLGTRRRSRLTPKSGLRSTPTGSTTDLLRKQWPT